MASANIFIAIYDAGFASANVQINYLKNCVQQILFGACCGRVRVRPGLINTHIHSEDNKIVHIGIQ